MATVLHFPLSRDPDAPPLFGADRELQFALRLARMAERRDGHDEDHPTRVALLSARIADRLGTDARFVELIHHAAALHDIGMLVVPEPVLLKPGNLSLDEWDIVKAHTRMGAEMLSASCTPALRMAQEIALYHHENWNGTGYTPGLGQEDIPLTARIVAVADVFDCLTHKRPYDESWSVEAALDWMQTLRAIKFDPHVLDTFFAVVQASPQILQERVRHPS